MSHLFIFFSVRSQVYAPEDFHCKAFYIRASFLIAFKNVDAETGQNISV